MSTRRTMIPASAPTSPTVTRSKADRRHPPVTPQRVAHSAHARQSSSPYTPMTNLSTPYTPFSLTSLSSSSNESNLPTPASETNRRRHSLSLSPEVLVHSRSLADIAENWRARANENGIKVAPSDDSQYQADESSLEISIPVIDKALLPAPSLFSQRRARAFSHATAPLSQIPDPTQAYTPIRASRLPGILNTPPPQPSYRLRGSVTDPAQPRRRPTFEQSELFDIDEDEFAPYPPAFASTLSSQSLPLTLHESFNLQAQLSAISEPLHFYQEQVYVPQPQEETKESGFACSVCGSTGGALAILEPCSHPLCSACLTSALNIVGEKDMECAVCKAKVDNFQLHKSPPDTGGIDHNGGPHRSGSNVHDNRAYNGPDVFRSDMNLLPSAFDNANVGAFAIYDEFMDRAQGASTPIAGARPAHRSNTKQEERFVLRIDNVPWDITPPAIATWLKHPIERVHVLLDRKGKTLSHAYAEMASPDAAKAALRSAQNSVLGRGKRARGVTVTKSSQEELMRALFPSWQGNFDGSRPSLSGLDNERVISTLQRGLLSEADLNSLLHLIRSPDSHFLKVPSLPFHSLISILSKFPADDDSRVFWSGTLRDAMYAAVQVLLVRVEENPLSDWTTLMTEIVRAAMDCQAFTSEQMNKLTDILEASMPRSTSSPVGSRSEDYTPTPPNRDTREFRADSSGDASASPEQGTYGDLAKEFGVEPDLIEALVQRLSALG
ncbi:uncharacterized protein LAESUDRAFT_644997 [Laetiporus sulphureus 93-53]|uniref:RING-type domain-containing protein n=1 Tax=Laetiporus sulphureus 93-53 TaxID=1314785 RepID=A0A165GKH3_9APHY|nr:uncharacterized protein LAESUDRAFT_644997 [Laetiporus sulphureus 93-53]KZT10477.1 hypothetical protein LAESUDRAFT_644997 [Laetiporus sulphureus 93-53]